MAHDSSSSVYPVRGVWKLVVVVRATQRVAPYLLYRRRPGNYLDGLQLEADALQGLQDVSQARDDLSLELEFAAHQRTPSSAAQLSQSSHSSPKPDSSLPHETHTSESTQASSATVFLRSILLAARKRSPWRVSGDKLMSSTVLVLSLWAGSRGVAAPAGPFTLPTTYYHLYLLSSTYKL